MSSRSAFNPQGSAQRRRQGSTLASVAGQANIGTGVGQVGPHRRQGNQLRLTGTPSLRPSGKPEVHTDEQDQQLRQQAIAAAQQGYYEVAIDLLSELLERHQTSATDYNNRGLVYFQSGQSEKAIADYNQAIELNPKLASVYNNRANYYAAQGQLAEAIADYGVAIDLNPGNTRAWINQGITFRQLEMYEQAIGNFELALHFGQLEGHIYAERGRTFHIMGDWNCAIADYQKALQILLLTHTESAQRLRQQVENWLNDLLSPLRA
ncbi:tetratricopeptide repeat protein [Trichocoleus desertorum AS-A10]|uniref:tetratricopeptide repeat protein n=1 Tax=Trichocoleus desertorum TaxID=1481672 RepID=UPI003298688A